ncbi:MAG: serine/threonine-protein kinase, partial [Acidobacteriota bacterium]
EQPVAFAQRRFVLRDRPCMALDQPAVERLGALYDKAWRTLDADAAADPVPGQRVGPYRIKSKLGQGGMGTVFLAERADGSFDRSVALKVLDRSPTDAGAQRRFLQERQILAGLTHPHIARLLDGGVLDTGVEGTVGAPYLVMDHVDGESIVDACRRRGLDDAARVRLMLQACDALHYAHRRGIVHRDVKPSNLLVRDGIDDSPEVVVVDFGIARLDDESPPVTATGHVFGTPGYMAPEQALGHNDAIDRRSDVFSIGVVLYELLAGVRPFEGRSAAEVLDRVCHGEPTPLGRRRQDVPRDLATIVDTCLAREPDRRYPSALALSADLERFLDGRPITARPIGPLARGWRRARRRPALAALVGGALVLALASLVAVTVQSWRHARSLEIERNVAIDARRDAEALMDFLLADLFDGLDRAGRLDLLESVAQRAARYYVEQPADDSPDAIRSRATALFNVGQVMEDRGDFAGAARLYEANRRLVAPLVDAEPYPAWRAELARSRTALASTALSLGDNVAAAAHADAGLTLSRELARREPRPESWSQRHFEALALSGWIARMLGDTQRALPLLDDARLLAAAQFTATDEAEAEAETTETWRHRHMVVLGYSGLLHQERGAIEKAIDDYAAARDLGELLIAADPTHVRWREELQLSLARLASALLDARRLDAAATTLDQARAQAEYLVQLAPRNANWSRELSVALAMKAGVQRLRGDLDGARRSIEASLAISRQLADRFPDNLSLANDLAWDLVYSGRLRAATGDAAAARDAWQEALDRLDALDVEGIESQYVIDTRVHALLELGRTEDARPLVAKLHAVGWTDPDFLDLCARHGLAREAFDPEEIERAASSSQRQ